jgi:hypothetical protein
VWAEVGVGARIEDGVWSCDFGVGAGVEWIGSEAGVGDRVGVGVEGEADNCAEVRAGVSFLALGLGLELEKA